MSEDEVHDRIQSAERYLNQGRPEEAWQVFDDLGAKACTERGVLAVQMKILVAWKQWQKAMFWAATIIREDPSNADAWYVTAVASCQEGDVETAKAALDRAFAEMPGLRKIAQTDDLLADVW